MRCFFWAVLKVCLLAVDFNRRGWTEGVGVVPGSAIRIQKTGFENNYSSGVEMIACDYADIY